ncbi:glutathione S-transferase family protein [Comamonas sp. NLF-1-9]|uniref:glutathione S-transferase family protein n=1 Tax=Comamonas sp. NLF-1-9 TaxID=2853163 RepID=UPI001C497067|nr:glutathione S-transferase [Comamonas sp. NLF-1-9]QXL84657.1 glutathione S-transferase [Comamonas sp. NLF-1-9]
MIIVHHLNASRSLRILWLLEELGQSYEIVRYQRDPKTLLAPPELKRIHPLGKSPVVQVDGETLAESGAIIETLVERFGAEQMAPPRGSADFARYRYWLHYAEGSAMPPLLLKLVFERIAAAPMPFFAKPIARSIVNQVMKGFVGPQLKLHLGYMESELARRDWFAGDAFSAADVQLSYPLMAARQRAGLNQAEHPRLSDWLARIEARPALQRAQARERP